MLLPSALSCDSSQSPLQSALFISPPTSPHHMSAQTAIGNLINSCRNLHSLISSPVHHNAHSQLPSPPLANMASPLRPRLRKRDANKPLNTALNQTNSPRYRIKKRVAPPRGANKRRRSVEDDGGRDDEQQQQQNSWDAQSENINIFEPNNDEKCERGVFVFRGADRTPERTTTRAAPSTPKRQRIAPPEVPRGLSKEDFHKLGPSPVAAPQQHVPARPADGEGGRRGGEKWAKEEDHKLVEIVLEKVKNMDLSNEVWDDCVRNLPGKDHDSVSSRWKSLLRTERVGLQNKRSRSGGKLHGTW